MPFEKGRAKTGGRVKGGPKKKSVRLIDQLKDKGFDYVKELAACLKALPSKGSVSPLSSSEFPATKYQELKSLLPFMAPKLKEKEVDVSEAADDDVRSSPQKISDADLLKALETDEPRKARPARPAPVATGTPDLQIQEPPRPSVDLQDLVTEQGEE